MCTLSQTDAFKSLLFFCEHAFYIFFKKFIYPIICWDQEPLFIEGQPACKALKRLHLRLYSIVVLCLKCFYTQPYFAGSGKSNNAPYLTLRDLLLATLSTKTPSSSSTTSRWQGIEHARFPCPVSYE
jgi:hypothetical protein